MKLEIDLDLAADLVARIPPRDINRLCRDELVLRLFAEGIIGAGDATRLLGLDRREFHALLRTRCIPHTTITADDVTADLADLEALHPRMEAAVRERRLA